MQQPKTPVLGPVLLVAVAVLSCLAYATGTVAVTRSQFTWPAKQTGEAAPLVLSAQSPESLTVAGPCGAADTASPVDLLTTGDPSQNALGVRAQGGRVWMTYLGSQAGDVIAVPGDCTLTVNYERSDNTAVLTAGPHSTSAALVPVVVGYDRPAHRQFAVTRLGAAPGFEATVVTQPTTFSSSSWRLAWLIACAGSLVVLGLLLKRRYPVAVPRGPRSQRWVGADTLVALTGAIALVVVPPRFDDGWVLTTVRHYNELGFFSNYYSLDAAPQPQGYWWTWIERLWLVPLGTPGFLLRLPAVLIVILTWWLLRRYVLHATRVRGSGLWAAAIVACTGLVGLQVTLRPEPLIALLLAAALAVVTRYAATREPFLLAVLGGLSALAISAHQTGWCVLAASAAVLPWAWDWLRAKHNLVLAAAVAGCSVALAAMLAMLGSNASLWWRSVSAFQQDTTTYQSWLDEGARITALGRWDNPPVTVVAVALVALAVLGFLLRPDRSDVSVRAAGWSAIAAVGGLFLTTSKLVDHYGAVMPAAAVLAGLALREIRLPVAVGATVALTVVGVVAFGRAGVWALGLERASLHDPKAWPAVSLVLLVGITGASLTVLVRRHPPPSRVTVVPLAGLAVLAGLLSLVPVVVDGWRQPSSWFGQQMQGVRGRSCGLLEIIELQQPPRAAFDSPKVGEGLVQAPVTPDTAVWARGPLFRPIGLDVLRGEATVAEVQLPPSPDVWAAVPVPPDAQAVRSAQSGVVLASARQAPVAPARDVLSSSGAAWWVEPGLALQAPCVQSLSIREGVLAGARFSVGRPGWVGSGVLANDTQAFEAGCAVSNSGQRGQCVVSLAGTGEQLKGRELRELIS